MEPDLVTIALSRFGLGPRPGERGDVRNPAEWLRAQLAAPNISTSGISTASVPTSSIAAVAAFHRSRGSESARRRYRQQARAQYRREAGARILNAVKTREPFRERLVRFWSNHFAVSVSNPQILPLVCSFEAEAIRPHVCGRFADMLSAVVRHPAMLVYLDNHKSVGPRSRVGRRRGRGLNENLAREILELHTVGSGYDQSDVTAFAAALTGWSIVRSADALTVDPSWTKPLRGGWCWRNRGVLNP